MNLGTLGSYECTYRGFVHVDPEKNDTVPGPAAVQLAADMLSKRKIKKTRKLHPLFGCGFASPLELIISSGAIIVQQLEKKPAQKSSSSLTVFMKTLLHRISYISSEGSSLGIVVRRSGEGKFKCHLFVLKDATLLHRVSTYLRTAHMLQSLLPYDQPWFYGELTRSEAEFGLKDPSTEQGSFLVWYSNEAHNKIFISVKVNSDVEHVPLTLDESSGRITTATGEDFHDLSATVLYCSAEHHPDFPCILTTAITKPKDFIGQDKSGKCVRMFSKSEVKAVLQSLKPSPATAYSSFKHMEEEIGKEEDDDDLFQITNINQNDCTDDNKIFAMPHVDERGTATVTFEDDTFGFDNSVVAMILEDDAETHFGSDIQGKEDQSKKDNTHDLDLEEAC